MQDAACYNLTTGTREISMLAKHPVMLAFLCSLPIAAPAQADGFAYQAYLQLPFGMEEAHWGLRASSDGRLFEPHFSEDGEVREALVDLRFAGLKRSGLSINGVAVDPLLARLSADGDASGSGADQREKIDWYQVAGVVVGVGLIAAVLAADDVKIEGCSGSACSIEPESPPDPDPADAGQVD